MDPRIPPIVLFDDGLGRFGPLTDLRASFELRIGARTAVERLASEGLAALWTRPAWRSEPALREIVAARHRVPVDALPESFEEVLLVNGRLSFHGTAGGAASGGTASAATGAAGAVRWPGARGALVEARSGHVVAARLTRAEALSFLESGGLPKALPCEALDGVRLFARPWEILEPEGLARRLHEDIARLGGEWPSIAKCEGIACFGKHRAVAHPDARILPGVIVDAEEGPVAIDAGAVIRPGAVIAGPVYVGPKSIVAERTLLKARTVIGPNCRAAGEIGNTIFQGFSNKAHDGHLGDSFVGEWVNLGAGTTNSNLLNTYGDVAVRLDDDAPLERSGRPFVGAVIGDHVKTAILTRLSTGSVIGTGSMIAASAFPPTYVPRFSWLTDEGRRTYRFDKFIEVARAVWARRGIEPSGAMIDGLRRLHERATSGGARAEPVR